MADCCKVIVTHIGHRPVRVPRTSRRVKRRFGNHFQDHGDAARVLLMLEDVWQLECQLDPGMPMDTVLVCNGGWPAEADEFINFINRSKTARGTLQVLQRENTGLSYGGYSHVFEHLGDRYKYWIFTEDDILFTQPGYAAAYCESLRVNNCHFVAAIAFHSRHKRPHVYGGVGFTERDSLLEVAAEWGGRLPYHDQVPKIKRDGSFKHHLFVRHGEIDLTYTMYRLGMRFAEMPGMTDFYFRWKQSHG